MPTDQITFSCTSCGVQLSVPVSFAGVTGPCPACQASITAPQPGKGAPETTSAQGSAAPVSAPQRPAEPPQPSVPAPAPAAKAPEPSRTPEMPRTAIKEPVAEAPEARPIPPAPEPSRIPETPGPAIKEPVAEAPEARPIPPAPEPSRIPETPGPAIKEPVAKAPEARPIPPAPEPSRIPETPGPAIKEPVAKAPEARPIPPAPEPSRSLEMPRPAVKEPVAKAPEPVAIPPAPEPSRSLEMPGPAIKEPVAKAPEPTLTPPVSKPQKLASPVAKATEAPAPPERIAVPAAAAPSAGPTLGAPKLPAPTPMPSAPAPDMLLAPPLAAYAPPISPAPVSSTPSPLPDPSKPVLRESPLVPVGPSAPPAQPPAPPQISRPADGPSDPGAERRTAVPLSGSSKAPAMAATTSPAAPADQGPAPDPVQPAKPNGAQVPDRAHLLAAPSLAETIKTERKIAAPGKTRPRLRWPTLVFPLLFLLLSSIVVYLVLDLSGIFTTAKITPPRPLEPTNIPNQRARETAQQQTDPQLVTTGPRSSPIITTKKPDPSPLDPGNDARPPVEQLDLNVEGEIPPTPKINLEPESFDTEPKPPEIDPSNPSGVLEKFLSARTLEQRRPYITRSKLSDEELAASCLARPLPEVINRRSVHYMENRSERHKEHFFEVFFQVDPAERAIPILVQLSDWGDGVIRVHADAFIDLFDDRLGAYAEKPVKSSATFHVVADAYKHCFDEIIPDWDKKSFLKLRTHPRMAPRLVAYFNRNSELAKEISQPEALPWGESGICTVTVRWNTDIPKRPFVELVKINGFTWDP